MNKILDGGTWAARSWTMERLTQELDEAMLRQLRFIDVVMWLCTDTHCQAIKTSTDMCADEGIVEHELASKVGCSIFNSIPWCRGPSRRIESLGRGDGELRSGRGSGSAGGDGADWSVRLDHQALSLQLYDCAIDMEIGNTRIQSAVRAGHHLPPLTQPPCASPQRMIEGSISKSTVWLTK
jgi:hypothetical protein